MTETERLFIAIFFFKLRLTMFPAKEDRRSHQKKAKNMHANRFTLGLQQCPAQLFQRDTINNPGEEQRRTTVTPLDLWRVSRLRADPFASQRGGSGQLASKPESGLWHRSRSAPDEGGGREKRRRMRRRKEACLPG